MAFPNNNSNERRRLIWHRRDLRLCDNELYSTTSTDENDRDTTVQIVPLYVINPDDFSPRPCSGENSWSTVSVGPHASRALIEALKDLRASLKSLGGDLLIRTGDPLDIIPAMAKTLNCTEVIWAEEPGTYEQLLSQRLKDAFQSGSSRCQQQVSVQTVMGYTLYHPDDLPKDEMTWSRYARPNEKQSKKQKKQRRGPDLWCEHPVQQDQQTTCVDVSTKRLEGMPRIMGDFRRAARAFAQVRPIFCIEEDEKIYFLSHSLEPGNLPTVDDLARFYSDVSLFGLPSSEILSVVEAAKEKSPNIYIAGENLAKATMEDFIRNYASTADRSLADVSAHNSSRFSTPLSTGALSPRQIYWRAKQEPSGREWILHHLEMRDFFLYSAFFAGSRLFARAGMPVRQRRNQKKKDSVKPTSIQWKEPRCNIDLFHSWTFGRIGLPLVDAGAREMMATGYCSNRVRQNMASVLAKDLKLDWRIGAEWFQFCLQDHCVGANWGNWMYFGGVGSDPKVRGVKGSERDD